MAQEIALEKLNLSNYVRPGDTVLWGQSVAEPVPLTRLLMEQRKSIGKFNVFLGATYSDAVSPEHGDCVNFFAYPGAGANRLLAKAGVLDIYPLHYSHLTEAIRSGKLKIDVLILQLAPKNKDGRYSLSMAYEYLVPAIDNARVIIAEVNDQAPWTHGERSLSADDIDVMVHTSRVPLDMPPGKAGELELAVARNVAALVEDGSTLQFGIGALPEAILAQLRDRRDLGVHSGSIGDQVAVLSEAGVITNAKKSVDRGVSVAGVMFGGKRLRDFCHNNPNMQFRSSSYTHDPDVLATMERFVSLNAAIEVDLTGQINAEVAAGSYVGAVGGAVDFARGAHRSRGGLPIMALPSVVGSGEKMATRIVAKLSGPVSTPRADAGLIVTEHGVADLRGQPLRERARHLVAIAHPQFREALERAAHDVLKG
jgi:acetyl-CoA hydrolase